MFNYNIIKIMFWAGLLLLIVPLIVPKTTYGLGISDRANKFYLLPSTLNNGIIEDRKTWGNWLDWAHFVVKDLLTTGNRLIDDPDEGFSLSLDIEIEEGTGYFVFTVLFESEEVERWTIEIKTPVLGRNAITEMVKGYDEAIAMKRISTGKPLKPKKSALSGGNNKNPSSHGGSSHGGSSHGGSSHGNGNMESEVNDEEENDEEEIPQVNYLEIPVEVVVDDGIPDSLPGRKFYISFISRFVGSFYHSENLKLFSKGGNFAGALEEGVQLEFLFKRLTKMPDKNTSEELVNNVTMLTLASELVFRLATIGDRSESNFAFDNKSNDSLSIDFNFITHWYGMAGVGLFRQFNRVKNHYRYGGFLLLGYNQTWIRYQYNYGGYKFQNDKAQHPSGVSMGLRFLGEYSFAKSSKVDYLVGGEAGLYYGVSGIGRVKTDSPIYYFYPSLGLRLGIGFQ